MYLYVLTYNPDNGGYWLVDEETLQLLVGEQPGECLMLERGTHIRPTEPGSEADDHVAGWVQLAQALTELNNKNRRAHNG